MNSLKGSIYKTYPKRYHEKLTYWDLCNLPVESTVPHLEQWLLNEMRKGTYHEDYRHNNRVSTVLKPGKRTTDKETIFRIIPRWS